MFQRNTYTIPRNDPILGRNVFGGMSSEQCLYLWTINSGGITKKEPGIIIERIFEINHFDGGRGISLEELQGGVSGRNRRNNGKHTYLPKTAVIEKYY